MSKINFLKGDFIDHLKSLSVESKSTFGKMNAHQMVEHFTDSVRLAYGEIKFESKNPPELRKKMFRFMMSEKPFRENTPNPNMPDEPQNPRFSTFEESLDELQLAMTSFFNYFEKNKSVRVENPFFGNLNFEEQVHLLHKHALHHLKQFGIEG